MKMLKENLGEMCNLNMLIRKLITPLDISLELAMDSILHIDVNFRETFGMNIITELYAKIAYKKDDGDYLARLYYHELRIESNDKCHTSLIDRDISTIVEDGRYTTTFKKIK